jgi:TonB family protein
MKPNKGSNWQDLLSRWLSGRITAREEQELDRHAQEDPFLAEALEGYRQHPQGDHAERLAKLKARFRREEERRGFPIWRIAAAAAILIVAGIALWQVNTNSGRDLAQMEPVPEESAAEAIERDLTPPASYDETMPTATEPEIARADDQQPDQSTPAAAPTAAPTPKAIPKKPAEVPDQYGETITQKAPAGLRPANAAEGQAKPATKPSEVILADQTIAEEMEAEKKAEATTAKRAAEGISAYDEVPADVTAAPRTVPLPSEDLYVIESEVLSQRRRNQEIGGRIRLNDGAPLTGATIRLPGSARSAVTDEEGRFSLTVPRDAEQLQLVYLDQNKFFKVGEKDSFRVDQYVPVLSEAVIARKESVQSHSITPQSAKSMADTTAVNLLLPHPSIDSTAYRQYIQDNLRYPEAAKAAGISGTVTLEFSFDPEGRPFNFFLRKSLGYGCDEEAMRLLREGPPWVAPDYATGTYSVRFEL